MEEGWKRSTVTNKREGSEAGGKGRGRKEAKSAYWVSLAKERTGRPAKLFGRQTAHSIRESALTHRREKHECTAKSARVKGNARNATNDTNRVFRRYEVQGKDRACFLLVQVYEHCVGLWGSLDAQSIVGSRVCIEDERVEEQVSRPLDLGPRRDVSTGNAKEGATLWVRVTRLT
eukprot:1368205-Rhodomonas_salina.1